MTEHLPCDLEAERMLLGTVVIDDSAMNTLRSVLVDEDWSTEAHRRIWAAMCGLYDAVVRIDRVTLVDELNRRKHLEAVGGLTYLSELGSGLPRLANLDGYLGIVKDKALLRRMIWRAEEIRNRCMRAEQRAAEILESATGGWSELVPSSDRDFSTLEDVVGRVGLARLTGPRSARGGVPLPWEGPQRIVANLLPEELVILAGPTGYGKTSTALQIAAHAARVFPDLTPVIVSLEMSDESIYSRLITQEARVDGKRARLGYLNARERHAQVAAAEAISATKLRVMDAPGATATMIRSKLRKLAMRERISLVVVDYLQLLAPSGKSDNRTQEVGANARALKLMTGEFKCPFLVLSQFNRNAEAEKRKPALRDLRESGEIEQHANIVWFIWPDAERAQTVAPNDPIKPVEFIFAKQRDGESNISWPMEFHSQYQRFEETGTQIEEVA